jgi:hypothetical protein
VTIQIFRADTGTAERQLRESRNTLVKFGHCTILQTADVDPATVIPLESHYPLPLSVVTYDTNGWYEVGSST